MGARAKATTDAIDELSDLLLAIYQGATEPTPWSTALERLRETFACAQATLLLRPPTPGSTGAMVVAGTNVTHEGTSSYRSHFFALDPFVGLPRDSVVTVHEMLGEAAWLQSRIYREFLAPIGILHILGVDMLAEGLDCRLRLSRSSDQPAFDEHDKARCRRLLPHFKLAIGLHARIDSLSCERELFAGAVDRMLFGTISFDSSGKVIEVNDQARAILDAKDGIRLKEHSLRADNAEENEELQRLLTKALTGAAAGPAAELVETLSLTRPSGRVKLGVVVRMVPLGEWSEGGQRPAVVVFLRDPERKPPASRDSIRRLLHLTRSEAALALQLAEGLSLEEAADALGITPNTARSHLRSIYAKTGAVRQSDLVRIILNSVATLGKDG